MARIFKKKKTGLVLVLGITCLFGYFLFDNFGAQAQEQIKIFPASFSCDSSDTLGTSWQNPEAAFSQDLGEDARFKEFNQENSAYPLPATAGNPKSETPKERLYDPTGQVLNSKQILRFLNSLLGPKRKLILLRLQFKTEFLCLRLLQNLLQNPR